MVRVDLISLVGKVDLTRGVQEDLSSKAGLTGELVRVDLISGQQAAGSRQ